MPRVLHKAFRQLQNPKLGTDGTGRPLNYKPELRGFLTLYGDKSYEKGMVEKTGLEPAASWSRSVLDY